MPPDEDVYPSNNPVKIFPVFEKVKCTQLDELKKILTSMYFVLTSFPLADQ